VELPNTSAIVGIPAADSRVKAVVNYFGPTDLAAKDIPEISKPLVKDFLGGTPEAKPDAALKAFDGEKMDAYAGLRPGLLEVAKARPGSRILDGQFAAVQQAVGTPKKNAAGFAFLKAFVEEAKQTGIVASFIEREGVVGRLSVALPG